MTTKSLADLEQEVTRFRDTITNGSVKMSQLLCGAQCNLMSAMLFDGLRSRDLLDGWVDMAQKWVEDGI
jgi:hypothetical protein